LEVSEMPEVLNYPKVVVRIQLAEEPANRAVRKLQEREAVREVQSAVNVWAYCDCEDCEQKD
jgi:hypothetical protein